MNIFHFGGDEVPHGAWLGSPACHEYLGHNNLTSDDADELMTEFVVRVGEMVHAKGLNFAGWEDGLMLGITEPFDRKESMLRACPQPIDPSVPFEWYPSG